jgi:hypothetical protein
MKYLKGMMQNVENVMVQFSLYWTKNQVMKERVN